MAPRELAKSTLGFRYPENRDVPGKNVYKWLADKQKHDGAEGFWRVHDGLYDLTDFVGIHPGGKFWLEMTKGTDVTEAFEAHHISVKAERILTKFHVRQAATGRHAPYTFKEDGFYRTLKKRVRETLETAPKGDAWKSKVITDTLLTVTLLLSVLSCCYWSYFVAVLAGIVLCWTVIASHNFFHRADNFRMYYFDLCLMSSREWRISHALSHHLLTNTIYDLEISMFEPFLEWLPRKRGIVKKYISWFFCPLMWLILFHISLLQRVIPAVVYKTTDNLEKAHLVPLFVPLVMYIFGHQSLLATIGMWNVIIFASSFLFGFIGLNAAHHHPDIFHDGDFVRKNKDWGVHQLDTVMDRKEITGSHFLVLTNFGDHALHHFFPTLDHGVLQYLYPTFKKTCEEFGIDLRVTSQVELIKGQFQQLLRSEPNKQAPDLLKYSKTKQN